MDRSQISRIAHQDHPIAAPVDESAVRRLVSRLRPPSDARVVDLGCGPGVWLFELLEAHPGVTGCGVDLSLWPDARSGAAQRGLADRLTWVEADAATWRAGLFDVAVCVGASHAFGGLEPTLTALRALLQPGGQVLLGDGIWDRPPSIAALQALEAGEDDFPDLAGLVATVEKHGFAVGYGHVSSLQEWDDYEWSWTSALVDWALHDAPTSADREQALAVAHEHRQEWLTGYRQQLGFATLVLTDIAGQSS